MKNFLYIFGVFCVGVLTLFLYVFAVVMMMCGFGTVYFYWGLFTFLAAAPISWFLYCLVTEHHDCE